MSRKDTQRQVDAIRSRSSELENHLIDEYRVRVHQPARVRPSRRRHRDVDPGRGLPGRRVRHRQQHEHQQRRQRRHRGQGGRQGGRGQAGRHAEARHVPGPDDRDRPDHGRRRGRPGRHVPVRRVPVVVGQQAPAPAAARRELEAERRRQRVDVQDPPGRQVPRRHAHDRRGRRVLDQRARRTRRTARTRCRRSPACSRRTRRRRPTRAPSCSSSTRRTATSPTCSARTTTTRSSSRRTSSGKWEKTFPGTGPWKMEKYTPNSGVSYVPNPDYWDKTRIPKLDRQEVKFYPKEQAQILALQSGRRRRARSTSRRPAARRCSTTRTSRSSSCARRSTARSTCATTRSRSTTSACARRWRSRSTGRHSSNGLMAGKSDFGNDSPFAPVFPSTDKSVAQRKQDLEKAKALMQQAGVSSASVTIDTWDGFELPDLAQLAAERRREDRAQAEAQRHAGGHVLRRRGLRQVAVAGLDDGHHRLRPPRRAERVPRRAAARARASGTRRTSRTRRTTAW